MGQKATSLNVSVASQLCLFFFVETRTATKSLVCIWSRSTLSTLSAAVAWSKWTMIGKCVLSNSHTLLCIAYTEYVGKITENRLYTRTDISISVFSNSRF